MLKLPVAASSPQFVNTLVDACDPMRRALYVERDGVLVWGGPVVARRYDQATQTFQLKGAEWWGLFHLRRIGRTFTWTGTTDDQLKMAQDLINYSQAKPGGDLGIVVGTETSGRKRDGTIYYYETKVIAEVIEGWTDNIDGYDFAIEVAYDSTGAIMRTFRLYYPRRGRIAGATGHVWELGRNIEGFTWDEDGAKACNMMFGIGGGEGDAMIRATTSNPSSWSQGYPLLEDAFTEKSIVIQQTLSERTNQNMRDRLVPVALPTISVRGDLDPQVGSYITGDEARIIVPPNVDPRFPLGLDTYRRIVGYDVAVPDSPSAESVQLILDKAVST